MFDSNNFKQPNVKPIVLVFLFILLLSGCTKPKLNNLRQTTVAPTASVSAIFNGWLSVKSLGLKQPAPQATDLSSIPANTTLSWSAVTPSSGSVASYNLYRATTSGAQDYNSPLTTGISASTRSYTDSTVVGGTTYYYTVAPVVNGEVIVPTASADTEITVITPPTNMALVHPWMANQEMCTLMGRSVDRTHHYRCAYTGPTSTGGYYQRTSAFFVDTYGSGCNYTYSSTVNKCGSVNGCIGKITTPNGSVSGNLNDVYYTRYYSNTGNCFINTNGGTNWIRAQNANPAQLALMTSNAPGLPPLTLVDQTQSYAACQSQTVVGLGNKRLLRNTERMVAAAWSDSLADADIDTLENGNNLDSTHGCNSNGASPQGNNAIDISGTHPTIAYSNAALPSALDTLPSCLHYDCNNLTYGTRLLRNGSNATSACVSRYGIQDLIGNAWYWTSDQLNACNTVTHQCSGITSTLDAGNTKRSFVMLTHSRPVNSKPHTIALLAFITLPFIFSLAACSKSGSSKPLTAASSTETATVTPSPTPAPVTPSASPSPSPSPSPSSISSKSLSFDQSNSDQLNCGDNLHFERTDAFSISAWVKWTPPARNDWSYGIAGDVTSGPSYQGYTFSISPSINFANWNSYVPGKIQFSLTNNWTNNNYIRVSTVNSITENVWNHIVVTYSGSSTASGVNFYINGALAAKVSIDGTNYLDSLTASAKVTGGNSLIGGTSDGTYQAPFSGNLSEVSYWSKALTGAEAAELYNGGMPSDPRTHSAHTSAIHWFRLGEVSSTTFADQIGSVSCAMSDDMTVGNISTDHP